MKRDTHPFDRVAKKLPRFEVRSGQLQMYQDVCAAYEKELTYLIEAGTGTGKSLAYLIPAILWAMEKGEPTVIATHTIALQEQLIQKDIPFLIDILGKKVKAVLAKGMHNYVCLRKLGDSQTQLPDSILQWSQTTTEGSKSELPVLPTHDLWEMVAAEAESCTHVKCPHYKECFFFKARKEIADAHIIVANHHLLFADLRIRAESENYTETAIFPPYKRLVLDEAHHCEDVATQYFAKSTSRRGIIHYLGRLFSDRGSGKLVTLYAKLSEAYPEGNVLAESFILILPAEKRNLVDGINSAFEALSEYFATFKQDDKCRIRQHHMSDPLWINTVQPPVAAVYEEAKKFLHSVLLLEGKLKHLNNPQLDSKCEGIIADIKGICIRLEGFLETLYTCVFSPLEPTIVRWLEGTPPDLHLISADLDISTKLSKSLFKQVPSIILCSATLSTNNSFSFVRSRLGIEQGEERIYPSPFNYQEQAILTVPSDLPDPSHPLFTEAAAKQIGKAVDITQGGTFVLFTSYAMLRDCERLLAEQFYKKHYHLLCQGDESRSSLLSKFRTTARAILFGTDSFWEGVDVAGDALRCVVIVKLPFKVPSDPLFQARSEVISQKGGSPFFEYSLPQAIVKFKQGFGRLIRTKEDKGSVICLDSRLATKGYGKKFLNSLPNCPVIFEPSLSIQKSLSTFYQTKKTLDKI